MSEEAAGVGVAEGVFTRYLRGLDPGGEPPDTESFADVRRALRGVLRRELGRRGLWQLPPTYLGIQGHQRWSLAESGDALDELTADGYVFVFIERIASLRAHLRLKPNIDGLVFLNVRHFVHERQQRHDPLGTRVFKVLRSAIRLAVEEEKLQVVRGSAVIRNDTVLAFEPGTSASAVIDEGELRHRVLPWMEALLPKLLITRGKGYPRIVGRLRGLVLGLEAEGVAAFRFKHLADVLKAEARARWSLERPGAEAPDLGYERRESLHQLIDCVERELASLDGDAKTVSFLRGLWEALLSWACDPAEGHERNSGTSTLDPDKMPTRRGIARLLGIPRDRLPKLYEMLGDVIRACRAAARPAGAEDGAGDLMDRDRWNELRQATGSAVARAAEAELEAAETPGGPSAFPRPGDVYLLRATGDEAIEWVVLKDQGDSRVLVVPADTGPMAGSADVVVKASSPGGPLTLRCAHAVSLPAALFEPELRSRRLEPESLEEALRLAAGARVAEREEVDFDPDYREEMEKVSGAVEAAVDAVPRATIGEAGGGSADLSDHEVTRLLQSWSAGSLEALNEMIPLVFDDLHRMACYFFQREPDSHTLQPTALVNLLYLRLHGTKNTEWENRKKFFHFAAGLMRHMLVDYARRRKSKKRGGGMARVPLFMASQMAVEPDFDILALNRSIEELTKIDERQGRIVEQRFFVGLKISEIAELNEISEATVKRELRTAKFWLHRRLDADRET